MSTLTEIESAADALPRSQQELLLKHLQVKLDLAPTSTGEQAVGVPETVAWPDYSSRLQTIYGDKAMPSLVLSEREMAPW